MGCDSIYLCTGAGNEFLYPVRLCKSISFDAIDRADSGSIWYFIPVVCIGICVWRWIFQCVLSDESGTFNFFGSGKYKLWKLGKMEWKIPTCKSDFDERDIIVWTGSGVLLRKRYL